MPQEGDATTLVIRSAEGSYRKTIQRGYGAVITKTVAISSAGSNLFSAKPAKPASAKESRGYAQRLAGHRETGIDAIYTIPGLNPSVRRRKAGVDSFSSREKTRRRFAASPQTGYPGSETGLRIASASSSILCARPEQTG